MAPFFIYSKDNNIYNLIFKYYRYNLLYLKEFQFYLLYV